jgi:hypothetical protein
MSEQSEVGLLERRRYDDPASVARAMVITLLVVVGLLIWRGVVLRMLWAWFIAPLFGLAPLSVAGAVGVMLVATGVLGNLREAPPPTGLTEVTYAALWPAVLLFLGWMVHFAV